MYSNLFSAQSVQDLMTVLPSLPYAIWETFYMTVLSTALSLVIGLPLGVLLVVGEKGGVLPLPGWLLQVLNVIINLLRSVPFLILMIMVFPLSRLLIGTTIGTTATIVPLVAAAFPFVARLVETSLREVDGNIIEAAQSMGATPMQIICKVMIPESVPSLIQNVTIALTTILGYSAMSGIIGGGGLGKIAIDYGYYRYKYLVMLVAVVLLILLVAALFYKDYASLFRNNKELVKSLSPSNSIVASWSWYSHQRSANLPLIRIGEDAHRNPLMQNGKRKNLTILIVGETSRAENFSLNGYPRETNPRLAKDNVVYFPNTASCGTATAVSVPCMFSDMPREHYKEELAQHQEGVLDIIQRAGINVLWNDNDGGCKGVCDRVPHQNVTALNLPGQCINGECYDEVLFHGLEDYINNLQGDGVIVLHTIGSHGPTYYNRYPPQFRKFTPTCDTNEIQTCTQEQLVNTYDNTLVYVDYIVDKAINLLKEHQDKFTTSLVYLSDHGESLGENGIYLHGLPYAIAPDSQKQVPMLLWLSEDYQKRYQVDRNCLQKQAQTQHYSQDNLFSTLLGLTGVETKYYQAADDILQTCRRVSE